VTIGILDRHRGAGVQAERRAVTCQVAYDFVPVADLAEDRDVDLSFGVSRLEHSGYGLPF
jgi:hypothetical protein